MHFCCLFCVFMGDVLLYVFKCPAFTSARILPYLGACVSLVPLLPCASVSSPPPLRLLSLTCLCRSGFSSFSLFAPVLHSSPLAPFWLPFPHMLGRTHTHTDTHAHSLMNINRKVDLLASTARWTRTNTCTRTRTHTRKTVHSRRARTPGR